jgi:hypothetical protein
MPCAVEEGALLGAKTSFMLLSSALSRMTLPELKATRTDEYPNFKCGPREELYRVWCSRANPKNNRIIKKSL